MVSAIEVHPRPLADPHLLAGLGEPVADTGRLAVLRADDGHVGHVDRHGLVDDAALHGGVGRLLVALGDVDAFHDDLVLGGQGRDDHAHAALAVPQFAPDGTEDAGPPGLVLVVDEHGGVLVEPDVAPVRTAPLLLGPDDDALDDLALLHRGTRVGILHRGGEDVADRGVAALRATQHLDAHDFTRT